MVTVRALRERLATESMQRSGPNLDGSSVLMIELADGTQVEVVDLRVGTTKLGERAIFAVAKG